MIIAILETSLRIILLIVVAVVEVVVAAAAVAVVVVVAALCSLFLSIPEIFLCQKETRPLLYFKLGI